MGLPYTVETASDETRRLRTLGEFRTLPVAIAAAKHSLDDERVSLAVVKDRDGTLVYAADRRREWGGGDAEPPAPNHLGSDT